MSSLAVKRCFRRSTGGLQSRGLIRYKGVRAVLRTRAADLAAGNAGPVLPMRFRKGTIALELFTAIATLGTPQDITRRSCASNRSSRRSRYGARAAPVGPAEAGACPTKRAAFWTAADRAIITTALAPAAFAGRPASAQVAQLVEHCTENAGVGGSNPPLGTTTFAECERRRQITVSAQIGRTLGTHTAKNIVLIRPFAKGRAAVRSGSRIQDVLFSAGRV